MDGHFFGGVADGITAAQTAARAEEALGIEKAGLGLRERAITQSGEQFNRSFGLQERAQRLTEQNAKFNQGRVLKAEVDTAIANTMKLAAETISAGLAAGRDPEQLRKAVTPLLVEAQGLGQRIGKDPASYAKQLDLMLTAPTPVETATTAGKADLAKAVASTPPRAPGVLPGDPTPDEKNRLSKMTVSYRVLDQELQGFEKLIQKNGVSILPGTQERVQYDASRRNIQMQMKELYNLGVLNGPDLMLMDSMIIDPTVGRAAKGGESGVARVADSVLQAASAPVQALYKSALLQGSAKANIKQLREQMKTLFQANRDTIMRLPPGSTAREDDPLGIRY